MPPYDFAHTIGAPQRENMAGFAINCYMAPVSTFTSIEEPVSLSVVPGDQVSIATDHTFAVGSGFIKVRMTPDSAKLMLEKLGGRDQTGFKYSAEFDHVGQSEEVSAEQMAALQSEDVIVLMPLPEDPTKFLQLGTAYHPGYCSGNFEHGNLSADKRAWVMKVDGFQPKPLYYTGVVTEKP